MSYEKFKEFYGKHPDLDNAEYYVEFPDVNTSTVRSWKSRARKPVEPPPPPPTPAPPQEPSKNTVLDNEMVKLLCTQTNTPYSEMEGIDIKSALIVLKAKLKNMQLHVEPDKPDKTGNSPILPLPAPIGQNNKKFGLDPYITFDKVKDEIRMEIPWDVLMDPEKNRKLGELE